MPQPLGPWTDERIAAIAMYAEQGYSCSQIAGLIGNATRNSVIGKLHRLGLSIKRQPGFKAQRKSPRPRITKSRIVSTKWNASGSEVLPPLDFEEMRAADVIPLHIAFADLVASTCRFPFGTGPYTYCGHDTLGAGSYCDQHYALAYRPPQQRQPRPDVAAANRQRFSKSCVLSSLQDEEAA
jgi:GcrA cell cycle regulator